MNLGRKRADGSLPSSTYGINLSLHEKQKSLYITVSAKDGMIHEIFGIFRKAGEEKAALLDALVRIISKGFQACDDIEESTAYKNLIVKQFRGLCGQCHSFNKGAHINSIPDYIAYVLDVEIAKDPIFFKYHKGGS